VSVDLFQYLPTQNHFNSDLNQEVCIDIDKFLIFTKNLCIHKECNLHRVIVKAML